MAFLLYHFKNSRNISPIFTLHSTFSTELSFENFSEIRLPRRRTIVIMFCIMSEIGNFAYIYIYIYMYIHEWGSHSWNSEKFSHSRNSPLSALNNPISYQIKKQPFWHTKTHTRNKKKGSCLSYNFTTRGALNISMSYQIKKKPFWHTQTHTNVCFRVRLA